MCTQCDVPVIMVCVIRSKTVSQFRHAHFDCHSTVCQSAHAVCRKNMLDCFIVQILMAVFFRLKLISGNW